MNEESPLVLALSAVHTKGEVTVIQTSAWSAVPSGIASLTRPARAASVTRLETLAVVGHRLAARRKPQPH